MRPWGEPVSMADFGLFDCGLVPVLVETTVDQRSALGFDEDAYQLVAERARSSSPLVAHPLFATGDGCPVRIVALGGRPAPACLLEGVPLDGVVPGAAAAFSALEAEVDRADLGTL